MTNTEVSERRAKQLLAREGFKMLSRAHLERYIKEGRLPKPTVINRRKYYKLADIERLLFSINRPTEIITPIIYPQKTRKCFINAGLG